MSTRKTKEENHAQADAFRRLKGCELELINNYAENFRNIISDFAKSHGRVPTADELLWIESERQGRDITQD